MATTKTFRVFQLWSGCSHKNELLNLPKKIPSTTVDKISWQGSGDKTSFVREGGSGYIPTENNPGDALLNRGFFINKGSVFISCLSLSK